MVKIKNKHRVALFTGLHPAYIPVDGVGLCEEGRAKQYFRLGVADKVETAKATRKKPARKPTAEAPNDDQ